MPIKMLKNLNLLTANTILTGNLRTITSVLILFLISCDSPSVSEKFAGNVSIIPRPWKVKKNSGFFKSKHLSIKEGSIKEIELFKNQIRKYYSETNLFSNNNNSNNFKIIVENQLDIESSYYELKISDENITIKGNKKGIFYGLQTLFQLITLNNKNVDQHLNLPCIEIKDKSTFQHRGFLMDCCRHFFSVKTIKKYINLLSIYKMNVLHWHLTEDQGWRIESDKYPKLNSIGSWRKDSIKKYGGFYTKKEIKEIVKYASDRYIEVIPEIELPGHSQAAIASYPYLSCENDTINVSNSWGVFKDIYCAGNDSVFTFLENVLQEITEIFPSDKVHIGGDEAPKFRWENCEKCQKRISDEGLKDENELQNYFIERVARILERKNKKIIGWDEINESSIEGDVTIQSWRGFTGGIKAVKEGKKVIMSPTSHCYFDYEIKSIDLEKVYSFNPIPKGLSPSEQKLIIGGECNLWSERIPNEKELDGKAFPRLLAISEVLWSKNEKDYEGFQNRVQDHYNILNKLKVHYGIEANPVNIKLENEDFKNKVFINSKVKNLNFSYHWGDGIFKKLQEKQTLEIKKSGDLTVQAFKDGNKYGDLEIKKIAIHLALNKKIKYDKLYSESYPSEGKSSLTNGELGSLDFKDGLWQGFSGSDINVIIDLDSIIKVDNVSMNFYQYINSWIVLPEYISIMSSKDSINWENSKTIKSFGNVKKRGKFIKKAIFKNLELETRYLKIFAKNIKKLPSWHEAAGSESWIFIDEIIVE